MIHKKALNLFDNHNVGIIFILLCIAQIAIVHVQNEIILENSLFHSSLSNSLSNSKIEGLINNKNKYTIFIYFFTPVILVARIIASSICLKIGAILFDYEIGFRKIFVIVVPASAVFILGNFLITLIVLFSEINHLKDLKTINDFSLYYLLAKNDIDIPNWLNHSLKTLNLIQVTFVLILIKSLAVNLKKMKSKISIFVVTSYGSGLIIWILFIMFLNLNKF